MQSRRKFLRDFSLVAAASLVPGAALAQNRVGRGIVPAWLGVEQFQAQVNTAFLLRAGLKTTRLLLVEAAPFAAARPDAEDAGNEKFSLLFRSPLPQPLEQNTYLFEHPRLGQLSIFVVPIGSTDKKFCYYEAIFDRPLTAPELTAQVSRAPRRRAKNLSS